MSPARALAENAYASRLQPFFGDEKDWPSHRILKIYLLQSSFVDILQEKSIFQLISSSQHLSSLIII
jgi:hypothetical protein